MIGLYLLLLFALGIYSYSQIDLNLTLLQSGWFLNFQQQMIQLGYFDRPLSTTIFLILIFLLSFMFYLLYSAARKERLAKRHVVILLAGISIVGLLSYPAFSHDIFNYIFDARIFVFHHANPYTSTALMFPNDSWTRFMNWTHRTYPYGPTFLPLTIPIYLLGFNKFILTLFWFKALAVAAYVGSTYLLFRLGKTRATILFALNPLIVAEAVIAAHLDVVMLFFALWAYFLLVENRKILSLVTLAASIGIKYATVLFLPFFIFSKILHRYRLWGIILAAYFGAVLQAGTHELLPHYFIVPLGFAALSENRSLVWFGILLSIVLLVLRYYSFLFTGTWLTISLFS